MTFSRNQGKKDDKREAFQDTRKIKEIRDVKRSLQEIDAK